MAEGAVEGANAAAAATWPTSSTLTSGDHWDHWLARWGVKRGAHRVRPGLYRLGTPNSDSPVLVTANYTLSFDAVRESVPGVDAYILVLDTLGVNVWCAAGKGTFGTDELIGRIGAVGLGDVVRHRRLILPQLGAPGVAAQVVRYQTGFQVEYGPVRARDLPAYLKNQEATPEMRRVRFDLADRVTLIPVELVAIAVPTLIAAAVLWLVGGWLAALAAPAAAVAGVVLFPILLPWLPTRWFSVKGFVLGTVVALPFFVAAWLRPGLSWWQSLMWALAFLLGIPAVVAYLGLNFTGSTTFTSRTGVREEIFTYIPFMASLAGIAVILFLALAALRISGGMP